ncbi:MAG: flavin oxidoreductase/NADH oxidase, partial [Clostridia bacterium]|nr:flavin oxidoreductase/NADH oxidase [Clostridia bacterium]
MIRKVYTSLDEFILQNRELETELPYSDNTRILGKSLAIGAHTLSNRLACQAMEGCDGNADGTPGELTLRRYDRFAKGGAGLIWYEATAVMPEGKANPRQLYINESNLDAFARQVDRIKETALKENGYAPAVIMQATHSGRYSKPEGVPAPLIAYNNPIFEKDNPIPSDRIVTDEYIDRVRDALVNASRLAEKAGFDGVDIKACHRYLNGELLSAYEREGRYGGSFENRTRLLREGILGAMEVTGKDFIVSTRMNVYDGFPYPYGFGVREGADIDVDLTEPKKLTEMLYSYGVRLINIT